MFYVGIIAICLGTFESTTVQSVANHPRWDAAASVKGGYDATILTVDPPINLGKNAEPICLPDSPSSAPQNGVTVYASGWGTTSFQGQGADILQVVEKQVDSGCGSYAGSLITDSMICAGVPAGGKDSCQGDSGGPLYSVVDGKYTQVGITSWGYGCAQAIYPGIECPSFDQN